MVFLPHVRAQTNKKLALIVDNASSHGKDLVDHRGQVDIVPLPPNVASVHQPVDMGIIAVWKKGYRKRMLRGIILNFATRAERRERAKDFRDGMKGLDEGYDPHMLDVA